jgi:imidazolonepropionase-like amidohydrolase
MYLIKNATVYTMETDEPIKEDILFDEKIIKIGNITEEESKGATIISGYGKIVTPGIVDPHCHIGMMEASIGAMGADHNEMTNPIYPEGRAIDAIKPQDPSFKEAREAGITSVVCGPGSANVIGGTFAALKTVGLTVEDMIIKPEVAMKCAFGENIKRTYGGEKKAPMTRMGVSALLREWLFKAKEYDDNKEKAKTDPTIKQPFNMKLESLSRVFHGLPLKIHAHQQDDIESAIRIVKEFGLDATIEHASESYIIPDYVKKSGLKLVIGPLLVAKTKWEVNRKSFKMAKVLYDHGIDFAIMTDHPVVPIHLTLLQLGQFVNEGLPYIEALKAVTIKAAQITKIDDRVGSLKVGKDADIVIWTKDPLHYLAKAEKVFIDGKQVK